MTAKEAQMRRSATERCRGYRQESRTENEEVIVLQAAEIDRLHDKLSELAKECAECDGTGLVTVAQSLDAVDAGRVSNAPQPCPDCQDIREVLGQ